VAGRAGYHSASNERFILLFLVDIFLGIGAIFLDTGGGQTIEKEVIHV
jgi:hypothetical protein